jgi:type I restriction enzyme, S subunit
MEFPRYDAYRDSGFDWLGEIPCAWSLATIRAVTELKSEKGQPDLPVLSVYREYGVILKDSRDDNHNATSLDTSGYKVVGEGDLVVNKMKAWQGSMGVSEHKGIVSPAYITCRVDAKRVYPKFLHYLLRSQPYIGVYNALSYGVRVGQWDMHYEDFKSIPLPLPDRSCQQRIAAFLDQKTAEIDEAIAKKQRLIELLKEQKAILINQAVTKGLNPDAPMRESGVEWIGEVPEHWSAKKAKFLFTQSRLPVQKKDDVVTAYRDGQVTLRSNRRTEGYTIAILEQGYQGIRKGQLVLNSMDAFAGAIGVSESDGKCSPEYVICDPTNKDEVVPIYYALLLREMALSGYIEVISSAVRQRAMRIRFNNLASLLLPIPTLPEQTRIVETVVNIKSSFDDIIDIFSQEIESINEYRSIIIANAVTGKIKI